MNRYIVKINQNNIHVWLLAFASNSLVCIHYPIPTMIPKIIIPIKTGASNSMRNTNAAGFV